MSCLRSASLQFQLYLWHSLVSFGYFASLKQVFLVNRNPEFCHVCFLCHASLLQAFECECGAGGQNMSAICQCQGFSACTIFTSRCLMGWSMTSRHGSSKAIRAPNCMSPMHGERWSWRSSVMLSVHFVRLRQTSSDFSPLIS